MNITKESTGNSTAKLKLEFERNDYQPAVDKKLKDYRRKANIPGFRIGMAPMEMVKKMVGNNIIADEINNIISSSIENYITENKLNLLGSPLASEDNEPLDFDINDKFTMSFDIAETPEFDINLKDIDLDYYVVYSEDEYIDKNVDYIRKDFGKLTDTDKIECKDDVIECSYRRLDENDSIIENEQELHTELNLEPVNDEFFTNKLSGLKVGDSFIMNPSKVTDNIGAIARMLNIEPKDSKNYNSDFSFIIKGIKKLERAELNNELYDKVFPGENIDSEEKFRQQLKDKSVQFYENDAERFFLNNSMEKILEKTNFEIPYEFLKRWMISNNREQLPENYFDDNKENHVKGFKMEILKSRLINDNNLSVSFDELKDSVKKNLLNNFYRLDSDDSLDESEKAMIDKVATQILEKEDEMRRFYDNMLGKKIVDFIKGNAKVDVKKINSKEFADIVMKKNGEK